MRLIFCHDHRFIVSADGRVFSPGQFGIDTWNHALSFFDEIVIYARRQSADLSIEGLTRCDRPLVRFRWMPDLSSPRGLMLRPSLLRELVRELRADDVVLARLPSEVGLLVTQAAHRVGAAVAADVVACVWDGLRSHGRTLARLYAPVAYWRNRRAIQRAQFVRYVTNTFLQRRYPTRAPTIVLSDASVVPCDVKEVEAKYACAESGPLRCAFIGPLFHKSKGPDVAIRAIAFAHSLGARVSLSVAGPGPQQPWSDLAHRLGVGHLVRFSGVLQRGRGVRSFLDAHDVLLLPSRQEGLSRVALEAMARGLPVLASTAGGNPEIVPPTDLHRPGDFRALARRIRELDNDRVALAQSALWALSRVEAFLPENAEPATVVYWRRLAELRGSTKRTLQRATNSTLQRFGLGTHRRQADLR